MINIKTISSGSGGNCYLISDNEQSLMIECGVKIASIKKAVDYNMSTINGCIISHEHNDHALSISELLKLGISVYATGGTITSSNNNRSPHHRLHTITPMTVFSINDFKILPFNIKHDASEPVGFLLKYNIEKLLYISDTIIVPYRFKNLTHIMIECNYSKKILIKNMANGRVSISLGQRIMKNHLSLEYVKEFLKRTDLSKIKEIHLLHVSKTNGDKKLFKEEIEKLIKKGEILCQQK